MKVPKLAFPAVAVVVAAAIGLIYHDIIPAFKEVTANKEVTATHHSQSAADNTKDDAHQEEPSIDHAAGLKPEASMFLPGAPVAAVNDHQHRYHANSMQRDLGSSSCEDSPLKVLTKNNMKSAASCTFISKKRKKRCKNDAIKSHCPNACRSCETFGTSDSEGTFVFKGDKTTCTWLHDLVTRSTLAKVSSWCQFDSLRATCRETCSFFCADGPDQSNMPSSLPSTSPTTSLVSSSPSTSPSMSTSTSPTLSPSTLPSLFPSTLPSTSPSTSPTTSPSLNNPPSPSPTTQCQGKITSIIDKHFGDLTKGPPQEEALGWLVEDISDDECDNEDKILQRYILAVLYFSTKGDGWKWIEGWLGNGPECDWDYVYCNDNQQVTELSLNYSNLHGTIPAELSSLTDLEVLSLAGNKLSGLIPGSIFDLPELESLFLSENDLTGTIPNNFGGTTSLKYIGLDDNLLTGTIPEIKGDSLQSIESLTLNSNKMSGPVPDSLCALRYDKPDQFGFLTADCAPRDNAQNPCPFECCRYCWVGKGLP